MALTRHEPEIELLILSTLSYLRLKAFHLCMITAKKEYFFLHVDS
jgi:hypothetical protein